MTRAFPLLITLLQIPIFTYAQTPVHHWPLNAPSGIVALDIGGNANGTLTNGPTWRPLDGKVGGALELDGADDRVDFGPIDLFGGSGITLAAWVKPNNAPLHEQFIIAKTSAVAPNDHSWSLSIINSTALQFRLKTAGVIHTLTTPGGIIFPGSWYHISGTYNGAEMRLYMNGSLMAFAPVSGAIGYEPNAFASIGDLSSGAQLSFGGWLDEVRIYDTGLLQAQVTTLVFGGVTTAIVDPVSSAVAKGLWMIMDVSGRVVHTSVQRSNLEQCLSALPSGQYTARALDGRDMIRSIISGESMILEQR